VIVATSSPDYPMPSAACLVQAGLGARPVAAFDLNAACSGFVYGLALAPTLASFGAWPSAWASRSRPSG